MNGSDGRSEAATDTIDDLLAVESRLDRSFGWAIAAFLLATFWPLAARTMGVTGHGWATAVWGVLMLAYIACYLWFAFAAGAAAARVGRSRLLVGGWILLVLMLPIVFGGVISVLIAASPLSLRFLLAGELRSLIRETTLA